MEADLSYTLGTPGCFLLPTGGSGTLLQLHYPILQHSHFVPSLLSYLILTLWQFQHLSLARCDFLKWPVQTSRHQRFLFSERLSTHRNIHFQDIRSSPALSILSHRLSNAFPASELLWSHLFYCPWLTSKEKCFTVVLVWGQLKYFTGRN